MVFGEFGRDAWRFALQGRVYMGILVSSVLSEECYGPVHSGQRFLRYGVIGEVRQTDLARGRKEKMSHSLVDGPEDGKSLFSQGVCSC